MPHDLSTARTTVSPPQLSLFTSMLSSSRCCLVNGVKPHKCLSTAPQSNIQGLRKPRHGYSYLVSASSIPSPGNSVADESEDTKQLKAQYAKYLPKGASVADVDWDLILQQPRDSASALHSPEASSSSVSTTQQRTRRVARQQGSQALTTADAEVLKRAADDSLQIHMVQWYPGHIARAERQLKEQLKMVDVVLEVRDARIPVATNHPQVEGWVGVKPRLLVMNRLDMVSKSDKLDWASYYKQANTKVFWTDGKLGDGIKGLKAAMQLVSNQLNQKRARRGLQPRPVRACVIGFPNIGKSALINRLIGRRAVESAAKPGVTRMLQWVRLSGELDLLDAPGVIPANFRDQIAAQRLAICNDIGEAAYVESLIAAAFVVRCKALPSAPILLKKLEERYKVDPQACTAEEFVALVADRLFLGDKEKAGSRILKDYRTGALGAFALELPVDIEKKRARAAALEAVERHAAGHEDP